MRYKILQPKAIGRRRYKLMLKCRRAVVERWRPQVLYLRLLVYLCAAFVVAYFGVLSLKRTNCPYKGRPVMASARVSCCALMASAEMREHTSDENNTMCRSLHG